MKTSRTGSRRCAYCRRPLAEERRRDAEYCGSSCRARASEARPARKAKQSAQKRSRASQTRRSPDLRISYRKAVDAMMHYPGAEAKLRALLTDRQRAAL